MSKQCSKCKQEKPDHEFYRDKRWKGSLGSYCRDCASEYRRWNYLRHRNKDTPPRSCLRHKDTNMIYSNIYHTVCASRSRAIRYGVENTLTPEEWVVILEKSEGQCYYCGKIFDKKELTMDHLISISKGGPNVKENIVACCMLCNKIKGTRSPKWMKNYLTEKNGRNKS